MIGGVVVTQKNEMPAFLLNLEDEGESVKNEQEDQAVRQSRRSLSGGQKREERKRLKRALSRGSVLPAMRMEAIDES